MQINCFLTDICLKCFFKLQPKKIPQHPSQPIPTFFYFAYIPKVIGHLTQSSLASNKAKNYL